MSDLNLNFDTGVKNITMGGGNSDNNIQVLSDTLSSPTNPKPTLNISESPNLSVSDPVGIEFLAKGLNSPNLENTPKSNKSEEFKKSNNPPLSLSGAVPE